MRKLFLAGVSVLALGAGQALAESAIVNQDGVGGSADVNQTLATGPDMEVFIDQAAGTELNSATVLQAGNGDGTVDINQTSGANNEAIARQTDFDLLGSSLIEINQGEDGEHFAEVNQSLDTNIAIVTQDGFDNTANVDQTFGAFLTANVTQSGEGNVADVDQAIAAFSTATVVQEGDNGQADIVQFAEIASNASISQLGASDSANADIFQGPLGGHSATIVQTDIDGVGGDASISQLGLNQTATILQTGTVAAFADVNQTGEGNTAFVTQ